MTVNGLGLSSTKFQRIEIYFTHMFVFSVPTVFQFVHVRVEQDPHHSNNGCRFDL